MDIPENPLVFVVWLVMSAVSFVLVTAGLRMRNLNWALWGVAVGAPTYAPTSPIFWMLGAVFGVGAYWVQKNT